MLERNFTTCCEADPDEPKEVLDLSMKIMSDGTCRIRMEGSMKLEELMKFSMAPMGGIGGIDLSSILNI